MNQNYNYNRSDSLNHDTVDLEMNDNNNNPIYFDQDIGGGGGGGTYQAQQQQPQRNNNVYTQNNQGLQESEPYKNPYSNLQSGAASLKNSKSPKQSQYYDVTSEQPIYVPPFLKENKSLRRDKHNDVNDFLIWSVANIFICVIIALPALFFSVQTRDNKKGGYQKKAKSNSRRALILNIIASTVGLCIILLAVILRFAVYHLFVNNDVNSYNVPLYQPYQPYKGPIN